ncbi:Uncharacterised protein [uncultured archaeon]|nr:Uncharacterised protein [uncultured archaeon]
MTYSKYIGRDISEKERSRIVEADINQIRGFRRWGTDCAYMEECVALLNRPILVQGLAFAANHCEYPYCRSCPEWLNQKLNEEKPQPIRKTHRLAKAVYEFMLAE